MIVGTVHQEVEHTWQDACDAWAMQDEQVEVNEMENEQARRGQCKKAAGANQGSERSEMEDLLVEGEEREYILELLMREVPPSQPSGTPSPRVEVNTLKGKKKRNLGKKLRKKLKMSRGAAIKEPRREREANPVGNGEKQMASNFSHSPEAKGRGLAGGGREKGGQAPTSSLTSGGECSG